MKVWVKLLIGAVLGVILGIFLPQNVPLAGRIIETAHVIALNIGRYTAMPLLFFALVIGIYELRSAGKFWPLVGRTFLIMIITSVFVISLGIAVTFIFPPERVPIILEDQANAIGLDAELFFLNLFPSNMLNLITSESLFIFPPMICAYFFAIGLTFGNHHSKLLITITDSLSRMFFHIAAFFSEILGIVIISVSAYWAVRYRAVIDHGPFKSIIFLLLVFCLILGLLILPALLYLLRKKQNPWIFLYGTLAPAIASFFSGDINFCLPVLMHTAKANLGIKRRSASVTVTLFTTFGRSGSAMVASIALIVIVKSYSSLGISLIDIASIVIHAFALTFLLGRHGSSAAFVCLAALCSTYERGFENGYLILKPIAFFLIALGTFLDVMIAALGSFIVAKLSGFKEDRALSSFV
jgi:Na+/H+-dicarboxylate symporter